MRWHRSGTVLTDCGLGVQATHSFADAWTDPDVLFVGGGAKPTLDLMGDSAAIAFLADRGSRARWVCSVCTGALLLGAAGLLRGYRAAVHWGARDALNQFGAESSSERVCIDRNRLTGGGITCRRRLRNHSGGALGRRRAWGESSSSSWSTHRSRRTARAALTCADAQTLAAARARCSRR